MPHDHRQLAGHVQDRSGREREKAAQMSGARGRTNSQVNLFFSANKKPSLLAGSLFFEARFARKLLLSGFLVIASEGFSLRSSDKNCGFRKFPYLFITQITLSFNGVT
jgi:hypothetical protein